MIRRYTVLLGFAFAFAALFPSSAVGQDNQDNQPHIQPRDAPPPRTGRAAQAKPTPVPSDDDENGPGESSSQDSQIDLNLRPLVKNKETLDETIAEGPFDPHRAAKDIEVGNYYLKQKNYRAALDRFHDALLYKPGDAEAIYGLAVTQEKLGLPTQAYKNYRKYLQILPNGPTSREAQEAVKRLAPRASSVAVESDDMKEAARNIAAGEACLADNRYDDARQQFEQAARLTPENPLVYFRLGQSLRGMQRLDPARQNYQKYLQLQPDGPFAADARKAINEIAGIIGK